MLQTMSTLGIFATLAFLVLILFILYSFINSYKATRSNIYLLLLLAFFVFYTNSLISPIPVPLKAIFWIIAGFAVGSARNTSFATEVREVLVRTLFPSIAIGLVLILAVFSFLPSFVKLNVALMNNRENKAIHYSASSQLPCIVYANAQLILVERSKKNLIEAANQILRDNPRCLDALGYLANEALHRRDYQTAKPYIYQLLDVAPARQSVVRLAAIYAMGAGDENLKHLLTSQGLKLGILTQSQIK
jgi:hypothetical protein